MTPELFYIELINDFPTLKERLKAWDSESIHFKMEEFAAYTKERISDNDLFELERCFQFQEQRIESADTKLINCITVSYCESLLLWGIGKGNEKFISLMGPRLLKLYQDFQIYYNHLEKNL